MGDDPTGLAAQIEAFDDWFRYAEVIGQQRLYNFLMTASIGLLGCAALMSTDRNISAHVLAAIVAGGGAFMSREWFILGLRQDKFHLMLERRIAYLCEAIGDDKYCFPIYFVNAMKLDDDAKIKEFGQLNHRERTKPNRKFLSGVPKLFGFVFALFLVIILVQLGADIYAKLMIK